ISGPAGVGKSEIAQRLLWALWDAHDETYGGGTSLIVGDALMAALEPISIEHTIRGLAGMVGAIVSAGDESVVIDAVVSHEWLPWFLDSYTADAPIYAFTLMSSFERIQERTKGHWPMDMGIESCFKNFEPIGSVIDIEGLEEKAVVDVIETMLRYLHANGRG